MKKTRIIFSMTLGFLLIFALPGLAQQDWWTGRWSFSGLNLTSEQMEKIQDLRIEFQKEILPLRTKLQTHFMEMRNMYYRGGGQAGTYAKQSEIDQLNEELEKKYMDYQARVRDLLTDKQKEIFDRSGGLGLGYGPGAWMGSGMGFGQGLGRGFGRGFGRGWGRGWNRNPVWSRGYGRGWSQSWGRGRGWRPGWGLGAGYGRGWSQGMGRGWRCPGLWNWR